MLRRHVLGRHHDDHLLDLPVERGAGLLLHVLLGVRRRHVLLVHPELRVELHFYDCPIEGEPRPLLGQELRWVSASELASLPLPEADAGLVALLTRR